MADLGPNQCLIDLPGSRAALTTPALVLDLDIFEQNLAALADMCGEAGLRMRPHAKTHKCSEIAKRQLAAGAVGICCATLHEAEVLVEAGISGVIVTSPVVGAAKINRLIGQWPGFGGRLDQGQPPNGSAGGHRYRHASNRRP